MRHRRYRHLALTTCAAALLLAGCSAQDGPGTTSSPPTAEVTAGSPGTSPTASVGSPTPAAPSPSPTASSASPSPTGATTQVIEVAFAKGKVKPAADRVDVPRGTRVRLEVTSDVADEVHLHGYDKSAALRPGRTTTLTFQADQKGLFEVEAEEAAVVLTSVLVR